MTYLVTSISNIYTPVNGVDRHSTDDQGHGSCTEHWALLKTPFETRVHVSDIRALSWETENMARAQ